MRTPARILVSGLAAEQLMKNTLRAFSAFAAIVFLTAAAFGQRKDYDPPARHAIRGTRGPIATGSDPAAEAGMRMYYKGGNSVDAGIAAMFAGSSIKYLTFGISVD